jgi:hypothetical protein
VVKIEVQYGNVTVQSHTVTITVIPEAFDIDLKSGYDCGIIEQNSSCVTLGVRDGQNFVKYFPAFQNLASFILSVDGVEVDTANISIDGWITFPSSVLNGASNLSLSITTSEGLVFNATLDLTHPRPAPDASGEGLPISPFILISLLAIGISLWWWRKYRRSKALY